MWIPLKFRILPIIGKFNRLKHSAHRSLCVKEAKVTLSFLPLPPTLHSNTETPLLHHDSPLCHGDIAHVESHMLNTFIPTVFPQILSHWSIVRDGLHDLESQRALLGETGVERERSSVAVKLLPWDCVLVELKNLKGADSEAAEVVDGLFVVGGYNADFLDAAEDRGGECGFGYGGHDVWDGDLILGIGSG